MRISDWSSDVCSSDLLDLDRFGIEDIARDRAEVADAVDEDAVRRVEAAHTDRIAARRIPVLTRIEGADAGAVAQHLGQRRRDLFVEQDRKSVVSETRVSVRVDLGGRLVIKKQKTT